MPDLPSPPSRTVVCCKAMLAAFFAVKSRCSVVSMPWPCMEQRQGRQFVGEMGVKARHCQALFSYFISRLCVRPCWLPCLRVGSRTPKVVRRAAGSPRRCVRVQGSLCTVFVFGAAPLRRGGRIIVCVPVLCQEEAVEQQILLQQEATAAARVSAMCSCSARLRLGEESELLSVFQFYAQKGP